MHKIAAIACGAVWSIAAPPVSAEPLVRMHTSYYYVDGASATVLAAQIDRSGPPGMDGKRRAGKTKWDVQWKFRYGQHGVTCIMKEVAIAIGIAQTLPEWRGETKSPASLQTRWRKFIIALRAHEDGHKDHGLAAGKDIEAASLSAKPASNCEELGLAANAAAEAIVRKYQKLDEDYGRSQGATLP